MLIENKYEIGEFVYIQTDPEQLRRVITGFEITQKEFLYWVACGESSAKCYEFELSKEKVLEDDIA